MDNENLISLFTQLVHGSKNDYSSKAELVKELERRSLLPHMNDELSYNFISFFLRKMKELSSKGFKIDEDTVIHHEYHEDYTIDCDTSTRYKEVTYYFEFNHEYNPVTAYEMDKTLLFRIKKIFNHPLWFVSLEFQGLIDKNYSRKISYANLNIEEIQSDSFLEDAFSHFNNKFESKIYFDRMTRSNPSGDLLRQTMIGVIRGGVADEIAELEDNRAIQEMIVASLRVTGDEHL